MQFFCIIFLICVTILISSFGQLVIKARHRDYFWRLGRLGRGGTLTYALSECCWRGKVTNFASLEYSWWEKVYFDIACPSWPLFRFNISKLSTIWSTTYNCWQSIGHLRILLNRLVFNSGLLLIMGGKVCTIVAWLCTIWRCYQGSQRLSVQCPVSCGIFLLDGTMERYWNSIVPLQYQSLNWFFNKGTVFNR